MNDEALLLLRRISAQLDALPDRVAEAVRGRNIGAAPNAIASMLATIAAAVEDRAFSSAELVAHAMLPQSESLRASIVECVGTLLPGCLCFIVRSQNMPECDGRVCEIVARWPQEPGHWYQISGSWISEQFPDSAVIVARENLLPLLPPSPPVTTHKAEHV